MFMTKRVVRFLRKVPYPVILLATALVYFALFKLGQLFAFDASNIPPFWPATGVALAAMLLLGYRIWPGIAAGAFVASALSYAGGDHSFAAVLLASLLVTTGHVIQVLLGAFLYGRAFGNENPFDRVVNVFKYIILVGVAGNVAGATVGVAGVDLAGISPWNEYGSHWIYWWLGSTASNLVITPFILVWIAGPRMDTRRRNILEAITSLIAFIAVIEIIFEASRHPGETSPLISALVFPLLFSFIWASVRFGHRGATLSLITFYILYLVALARGLPTQPPRPLEMSLLLAQFYMVTIAPLTLIPSAMTRERKESREQILKSKEDIERINSELKKAVSQLKTENAEREQAQLELERSNAELQQFAYVASHDLQEPLRMVASFVGLLEEGYGDKLDENAREYIGFAVEGANRMQKLINDLLAYSRVATVGKAFALCDFGEALKTALADLKISIDESHAQITYDQLPQVPADCSQITQVWQNLIGNAIRFRGQAPLRISITAKKKEEVWKFAVKDNGIGIDPKYAGRVFEIFQRLGKRKGDSGTGIGLAICKRIVERHHGEIWVKSEPGKGSTFYFTIPESERH